MNQDSLKISNVYAAYTAQNSKTNENVSTLSKMVKGSATEARSTKNESEDRSLSMDKVVISKEALALLDSKNNTVSK